MKKNMKRIWAAVLVSLLLVMSVLPVAAAKQWNDQPSRMIDYTGTLTDEEINNINENCIKLVSAYRVDAAGLLLKTDDYAGMTLAQVADRAYEAAGYGYGDTKDGFMVSYDMEANLVEITTYGAVTDLMTENYINNLKSQAIGYLEKYGPWGVIVYPMLAVQEDLQGLVDKGEYEAEGSAAEQETAEEPAEEAAEETAEEPAEETAEEAAENSQEEDTAETVTANTVPTNQEGMPDWYPAPGTKFTPFHNVDAPRVVDEADIFTADEETIMLEKIRNIQDSYEKDIVIYTSSTAYGMEKEALASDFYDYCGYGLGDGYEGMCLLFVMDPEDRGFRVSAYGPETRELYTRENALHMDDCLYHYVKDKEDENGDVVPGDYGGGVLDWLDNATALYECGDATIPSWYEGDIAEAAVHNSTEPRATMEMPYLATDAQLQELEEKCGIISEKTGVDIAVHLTNNLGQMEIEEYAEQFYNAQGYGYGDTFDGMLLVVYNNWSLSEHDDCVYVGGNRLKAYTEVNRERSQGHVSSENTVSFEGYEAAAMWLKDMEHMADTGRVAHSTFYWIVVVVGAILFSGILSVVLILREDGKRKEPRLKTAAEMYAVPKTLIVTPAGEQFIRIRKEKVYAPEPKDSDRGSSSSGGYNSSYTSSSGRSHTTSGRDF